MDQAFSARTEADPMDLYDVVADLGTYPDWLDVVSSAVPTGEPDTWLVTLTARVGRFARSKRLRMVRTIHDRSAVRFERREVDGKLHSSWVLAAEVEPLAGLEPLRSEVSLSLRYDGAMWSRMLDGVLDAAAERATAKLQAYVRR